MSISTIKRQVKNVAYNFSDAQVKVREATCKLYRCYNADYDVLLIFIQKYFYFRFKENNSSSSISERRVRRSETGTALDIIINRTDEVWCGILLPDPEYEDARPSSVGEEEMQLQIALALSREEHEKMDEMRKSDEVRLQLALEESQREAEKMAHMEPKTINSRKLTQSALDDLLSLGVGELVVNDQPTSSSTWGGSGLIDPWGSSAPNNQQQSLYPNTQISNDPWAPAVTTPASVVHTAAQPTSDDPFSAWEQQLDNTSNDVTPSMSTAGNTSCNNVSRKTPENFLGENSNLVNLDNLLGTSSMSNSSSANPFLLASNSAPTNPFAAQQRKSPTLNEMRAAQSQVPPIPQVGPRMGTLPQPLQPTQSAPVNPFDNPF
uniref:Epsin-2 n=1 Tax=Heterorhabditis bacteriophora TaxID=37862 RepID=A0A1I7X8U7_HETBA